MNTKKLKDFFTKYKYILIFALLTALATGFWSWQRGDNYNVSISLTVSRLGEEPSADYRYDNYYAIKASDEFGDTIAGWFRTPEMGVLIYQKAGFGYAGQSLSALAGRFNAAKIAPNLVEVRFSAKTEKDAKNLSMAVTSVIGEKTALINSISSQGISFVSAAGQPVIAKNLIEIWLNFLAGFLIGLAVGIFGKYGWEYLK